METPIAVNQVEITEELFLEGLRDRLQETYKKTTSRLELALGLVLIAACVATRMMGGGPAAIVGEAVLMAAAILWLRRALPRAAGRRAWQRMSRDGLPRRETKFYDSRFTVRGGDGVEEPFAYGEVVATRATEHLLLLKLESGQEIMLDRAGFTAGGEENVLERVPPLS